MKKLAIFASGFGSNFQAIQDAIDDRMLDAKIEILISDNPKCLAIERAGNLNINVFSFYANSYANKDSYEKKILNKLECLNIDLVVLAGYMKIIGPTLLHGFKGKFLNIHPSLLPAFKGKDAIGQAINAKVKKTGVTVHYVTDKLDSGKVIAQEELDISNMNSRAEIEENIHIIEHRLYPKIIKKVLEGYMKRALISVSDKTNIIDFTKTLIELGYEIISTGGTKKLLEKSNIKVISIDEFTGFPEILNGRVKTLHPKVHGGLLALRDNESHIKEVQDNNIEFIDLVCVNLYPFKKTISKPNVSFDEAIEQIDIGGPSMLRSAAKNYKFVTVVTDISDYQKVLDEIRKYNDTTLETKKYLSKKVFQKTAQYDAYIAAYLSTENLPEKLTLTYDNSSKLRYGENPHQQACVYKQSDNPYSIINCKVFNGKELSYNNIQDANAAINILAEFKEPTAVCLKHMNPCGVASDNDIITAYRNAYLSDSVSVFGGIVALNREVSLELAEELNKVFLEIIIAPSYTKPALNKLKQKKNLRVLQLDTTKENTDKMVAVSINGGILYQESDKYLVKKEDLNIVTELAPSDSELDELMFSWKVVKHVKSNAIVITHKYKTVGIGAGQMNRIGAAKIALDWVKEHNYTEELTLSSDAFFPFDDVVRLAKEYGVTQIIQPGGSIRDKDSIKACNELGIKMVFTGNRHFKH